MCVCVCERVSAVIDAVWPQLILFICQMAGERVNQLSRSLVPFFYFTSLRLFLYRGFSSFSICFFVLIRRVIPFLSFLLSYSFFFPPSREYFSIRPLFLYSCSLSFLSSYFWPDIVIPVFACIQLYSYTYLYIYDIVRNISALEMSKNKWIMSYILLSCVLGLFQIFSTLVKSREIYKLSRELFHFIWSPVAVTNSEEARE